MHLLTCACGRVSSALGLHFCATCSALRCAHPSCAPVFPDAGICPLCLRVASSAEVARAYGRCVVCTATSARGERGAPARVDRAAALSRGDVALPRPVLARASPPAASSNAAPRVRRTLADLLAADAAGTTPTRSAAVSAAPTQPPPSACVAAAPLLAPNETRRCAVCVAAGRPGLLSSPGAPGPAPGAAEAAAAQKTLRLDSPAACVVPWLTLVRGDPDDGEAAWWRAPPRQQAAARGVDAALEAARARGETRVGVRVHFANPAAHAVGLVFDFVQESATCAAEAAVQACATASVFGGPPRTHRATFRIAPAEHAPRALVLAPFDADVLPEDDHALDDGGPPPAFPWPASLLAAWRANSSQEPRVLRQSSALVPCELFVPPTTAASGRLHVTAFVHPDTLRDLGSSVVGAEAVEIPLDAVFLVGDSGGPAEQTGR